MKYRLLFLLVLLFSCQEGKVPQENKKVKIGKFDADSAYAYIEKQVAFGKRYMNTQAHEDCKNWLVAELKSHGLEVIRFTNDQVFNNLETVLNKIVNYTCQPSPSPARSGRRWPGRGASDSARRAVARPH